MSWKVFYYNRARYPSPRLTLLTRGNRGDQILSCSYSQAWGKLSQSDTPYPQRSIRRLQLTQQQKTLAKSQKSGGTGRAATSDTHTSYYSLRCFSGPQCPLISYKPEPFSPRITTPEKERGHLSTWQGKRLKSSNLHPSQPLLHWTPWAKRKAMSQASTSLKLQFRFIFFLKAFLLLGLNNALIYHHHLRNKHPVWFQVRNHSPSQK